MYFVYVVDYGLTLPTAATVVNEYVAVVTFSIYHTMRVCNIAVSGYDVCVCSCAILLVIVFAVDHKK